jgi:hypothetical protein
MSNDAMPVGRSAPTRGTNRWWLAPVRCGARSLCALRGATALSERYARSWLARSPVGIRMPSGERTTCAC